MPPVYSRRQFGLSAAAGVVGAPGVIHAAAKRGLTVVELFTSQLCPGCPVADAYLIDLARREELISLSFSVTHYDRGAFRDPFGKEEFNRRQFAYARAFRRDTAFTPEIVVNGQWDAPGMATGYVEELLAKGDLDGPTLAIAKTSVQVGEQPAPEVGADVWAAHYDPRQISVPIRGLEDRALPHVNVVQGVYLLGRWSGEKTRYEAPPVPTGLRRAVVVQTADAGPILAAARG